MSIELLRSAVLEAHHTGGDRKVSIKLLRYAVLWEKMWRDRKVSIELLRSAVIGSVHRTAEVRSSIHTKNVSIKLPRSAVLWTLWKTATGGRCSQVLYVYTVRLLKLTGLVLEAEITAPIISIYFLLNNFTKSEFHLQQFRPERPECLEYQEHRGTLTLALQELILCLEKYSVSVYLY